MDGLRYREPGEIAYGEPPVTITPAQQTAVLVSTMHLTFGLTDKQKRAPLDWVEDMMPTRIGEYMSPHEIFRLIQHDGYRGTFKKMLAAIRLQTERQFRGEVRKSYIILEPARPENLPPEIPTPLILVPAVQQFVNNIELDQSWAEPFLPKESPPKEAPFEPEPVSALYDPHFPYVPSLWSFDQQTKTKMLDAMHRHRVRDPLMSLVDEFMISRMGEYVHPYDLLIFMKGRKFTRSLLYLFVQVFTDSLRKDLPYRIVRPAKPKGLPKNIHVPLVLVPMSHVAEVEDDTMWSVNIMCGKRRRGMLISPGVVAELNSLVSESRALSEEMRVGNGKIDAFVKKLERSMERADELLDISSAVRASLSQFLATCSAYAREVESVADFWDMNGHFVELRDDDNLPSAIVADHSVNIHEIGDGDGTSCLEWTSKFRGRESLEVDLVMLQRQGLSTDELADERRERLRDPMYIIRDVLNVLGNSIECSMSVDEIRTLLPFPATRSMILAALILVMEDCRTLGSYSGTVDNMQHVYTEPFELKRLVDHDSQITRYQLSRRSSQ